MGSCSLGATNALLIMSYSVDENNTCEHLPSSSLWCVPERLSHHHTRCTHVHLARVPVHTFLFRFSHPRPRLRARALTRVNSPTNVRLGRLHLSIVPTYNALPTLISTPLPTPPSTSLIVLPLRVYPDEAASAVSRNLWNILLLLSAAKYGGPPPSGAMPAPAPLPGSPPCFLAAHIPTRTHTPSVPTSHAHAHTKLANVRAQVLGIMPVLASCAGIMPVLAFVGHQESTLPPSLPPSLSPSLTRSLSQDTCDGSSRRGRRRRGWRRCV
jgi:hypothetical protein